MTKRFWREIAVIGAFLAVALIFTFPLVLHVGDSVPGEDSGDAWQMVWNLWWVRYALENNQPIFYTNLIFHPTGADLHLHALNAFNGFLSLPIQYLAGAWGGAADGAVAGYNFIVFFSLTLSAYGAFCLTRYLWGDWRAAGLAGLAYGFCTYHFSHLLGHLNLISSEFIPFYILFLLRTLQGPAEFAPAFNRLAGWQWLWAVLALVATTFLELQYILYLALFTLFYLLYLHICWLLAKIRRSISTLNLGRIWLGTLLIGGGYALLSLPFTWPIMREALTNSAIIPKREERIYSADLLAYLYPSPFQPLWGKALDAAIKPFTATLIEKVVFPGFTLYLLILAGFGWWLFQLRKAGKPAQAEAISSAQAKPHPLFWLATASIFALLSFGPELHINGKPTGLNLPGSLIYSTPILNLSRVPSRFAIIAVLALGILAAWGLTRWQTWLKVRHYNILAGAAFLLLAFELLPTPYRYATYSVPQFYSSLGEVSNVEDSYSILDVPLNYGRYQYTTNYLKEQMTHHQPIANGYISRNPYYAPYAGLPVFKELRDFVAQPQADILPPQTPDPAILRYFNVRYVSVRKTILSDNEQSRALAYLAKLLPDAKPYLDNAEMTVFTVPPGPPATFFYHVVDTRWHLPEKMPDGNYYRWLNAQYPTADIDFWSAAERTVTLDFSVFSFQEAHDLEILLNGQSLTRLAVPLDPTPVKLQLKLQPGRNSLTFRPSGRAFRPSELDPASKDNRLLSVGVSTIKFS